MLFWLVVSDAGLAQLAEHPVCNWNVAGSSPATGCFLEGMAVEKLQTRKQWLAERVMPNLIVAMIAGLWIAMFISAAAFGVGLLVSTFQRSVGIAIVSFFVAFPVSSKMIAKIAWKAVVKDAEAQTFKAE